MKKRTVFNIIFLLLLLKYNLVNCQTFDRNYKSLHTISYVEDKNFYLFTLIQSLPEIKNALLKIPQIQSIVNKRNKQLINITNCKEDVPCNASKFLWAESEMKEIGTVLRELASTDVTFKAIVKNHLRPSGRYIIYSSLDDGKLLESAWIDATTGINHIINTYAIGNKPHYPDIDSISYDVQSNTFRRLIEAASLLSVENVNRKLFFEPSLDFALSLLEINNRDEAARFEPLKETENAAAIGYIKTIKWNKYPYSVILVPGAGNDLSNVSLSAWGKIRIKIAVDRYKKGLAPIIAVSGGYVHPFQTPHCEAYEMKKYLIHNYHIPSKAIIIEPHARHTTTNIRNVNRLMYDYGIPAHMKALIVTTQSQSVYIEDKKFEDRCLNEMKCVPYQSLKRISIYDLEYLPNICSLYFNPVDPLDP